MNPQERDLKFWNWKLTEGKGKLNNRIDRYNKWEKGRHGSFFRRP